jgi:hypothetical protein
LLVGNGAAALGSAYGIKKLKSVLAYIYAETAAHQMALQRAIDSLSDEPRPDGYEALDEVAPGYAQLIVQTPDPRQLLSYLIDDERRWVTVLAIQPVRFQA